MTPARIPVMFSTSNATHKITLKGGGKDGEGDGCFISSTVKPEYRVNGYLSTPIYRPVFMCLHCDSVVQPSLFLLMPCRSNIANHERQKVGLIPIVAQLLRSPSKGSEKRPNGAFSQFTIVARTTRS